VTGILGGIVMIRPVDTAPFVLKEGERTVTREQILQAMAKFDGKDLPTNRRGRSVEENGKRYDSKWILKLASNEDLSKFRLTQAEKTLEALGFRLLNDEDAPEVQEVEEAIETTFTIESDLQAALRLHIDQLEPGLEIIDGGKEKIVDSGRIDITARDIDGATVVIELKAGEASRRAIGQILAYMGDLTDGKKPVRGILVARDLSQQAIAAARVVPGLQLRKYSFKFTFQAVGSD
jgi:hypothetical protein